MAKSPKKPKGESKPAPSVPDSIAQSVKWLVTMDEDLENKTEDYKLALKAVADKFEFPVADLKAGITAIRQDKVSELLEKIEEKQNVLEAITG